MHVIELHTLEGAMPSSVAITADVLATANRLRAAKGRPPAFSLTLSGPGMRGLRALADTVHPRSTPAQREREASLVIFASLVAVTEPAITARLGRPDAAGARRVIERAVARGAAVAASCSAVFLLGSAGVLDDRRATTTWWLAPAFARMFPRVRLDADAMVVTDGPITTAGAAMAHLDLMLTLVSQLGGAELAERCARFLLLDGRRSQSRYMALGFMASKDPDVAKAERWARARLASGITVDELAQAAGLSTRTLARRLARTTGLSPVQFLQRMRVEHATELLETTSLSVEEIARRVGYAEPTTLRRLLRRDAGARPRDLRPSSSAPLIAQ